MEYFVFYAVDVTCLTLFYSKSKSKKLYTKEQLSRSSFAKSDKASFESFSLIN